jgi:hypothetical protein
VRVSRQSFSLGAERNAAEAEKSARAGSVQVGEKAVSATSNARDAEKSARHALHYITMR